MTEKIKKLCPLIVVPIEPERYNELYARTGNLNRLLAWGHAWTVARLGKDQLTAFAKVHFKTTEAILTN